MISLTPIAHWTIVLSSEQLSSERPVSISREHMFVNRSLSCGVFVWTLCTGWSNFLNTEELFRAVVSVDCWELVTVPWALIVPDIWTVAVERRRSTWLYGPFNTVFEYLYELVSRVCGICIIGIVNCYAYNCHLFKKTYKLSYTEPRKTL